MFRILHISDLHFSDDLYQPRVIAALCADINRSRAETSIQAVVFSGDAAAKGNTSTDNIAKIFSSFISCVRDAAGSEIPILICPGNHDIDLTKKSSMFEPVFAGITSPAKANELVRQATQPESKHVWAHIDGFRALAEAVDKDAFTKHPLFTQKLFRLAALEWDSRV